MRLSDDASYSFVRLDPIQSLMKFMFNTGFINAHLAEMNYDARKLPLGKLAKSTILNGFGVLKVRSPNLTFSLCCDSCVLKYIQKHNGRVWQR